MLDQPTVALGEQLQSAANIAAYVLSTAGTILVLTSFYRLGITGTYLGDYFGILMDEMVTGFPFTILANPMYVGTTMNFLAGALWLASPAGALVTVWVYFVYMAAISFEEYVCAPPHSNLAASLILTRTSLSLSLSLSLAFVVAGRGRIGSMRNETRRASVRHPSQAHLLAPRRLRK